jgi:hypothetical protein
VFHDYRGFFQGVVNSNVKERVHDISSLSLNRLGIPSRLGFHKGVVNSNVVAQVHKKHKVANGVANNLHIYVPFASTSMP